MNEFRIGSSWTINELLSREPSSAAVLNAFGVDSCCGGGDTIDAAASPDVRLIVFRLAPGQSVAPHRSTSSVQLTVLEGDGILTGESGASAATDHACTAGDVFVYLPNELHGMRATAEEDLLLLATITPRPGGSH